MINQDKVFQLLTEIEEKNIPNKLMVNNLVKTRSNNIENSKQILKKYGINFKSLDSQLEDIAFKIVKGKNYNINEQLNIMGEDLKNKLDKINDNKTVKIVILNLFVYMFNFLVWLVFDFVLRKFKIKSSKNISVIITSFMIAPITDQLASKISEKGKYESGSFEKYGLRFIMYIIQKLFLPGTGANSQLIISLSGIIVNKLKWLFSEELDNFIIEKIIMEIRSFVYNCYVVIFKIIEKMGTIIPGGGIK